MKISKMTTDQAADALARLAQPIANILEDNEVEPLVKELSESREMSNVKIVASFLPRVVSLALKNHRADLYEVVGALAQKPASQVGKMPILDVMNILKESIDKDLLDFFKSSGEQIIQAGAE